MQATWVRFPADTCSSRGTLVEDGDDLGQGSLYIRILSLQVCPPNRILANRVNGSNPACVQEMAWHLATFTKAVFRIREILIRIQIYPQPGQV
jgi:hypothetical protein